MNRQFTERVTSDLQQIAEQATPSSTAWESIHVRIDESADKPDMEVIMLAPDEKPTGLKGMRWGSWVAAAAAVIVLVVGIVVVVVVSDSDDTTVAADGEGEGSASADPAVAVIEALFEAYNAHDIDAVLAVFTEDAVVTGHPLAARLQVGLERPTGLSELRTLFVADLSAAAEVDPYTIFNVERSGDTVTWDHEWFNLTGAKYCRVGHVAVIADGKIASWTWPPGPSVCL